LSGALEDFRVAADEGCVVDVRQVRGRLKREALARRESDCGHLPVREDAGPIGDAAVPGNAAQNSRSRSISRGAAESCELDRQWQSRKCPRIKVEAAGRVLRVPATSYDEGVRDSSFLLSYGCRRSSAISTTSRRRILSVVSLIAQFADYSQGMASDATVPKVRRD